MIPYAFDFCVVGSIVDSCSIHKVLLEVANEVITISKVKCPLAFFHIFTKCPYIAIDCTLKPSPEIFE
jgi:hypothetical protein